jgi:hypothetical protein
MRTRFTSSRVLTILSLSLTAFFLMSATGEAQKPGLNSQAEKELRATGLDKYLGEFTPISSEPWAVDWTKHTFDSDGGDGPICIAGGEYSVFTKEGNPEKVLIFFQGGGACWEGLTACTTSAEGQFPPPAAFLPGIFSESSADGTIPNDIGTWSVVYLPYCDGSVFGGDNDVDPDPVFGTRRHRGLRNASAGMDVAKAVFPNPEKVLLAGSSAGGVGATALSPFLARFLYGNKVELFVFNDAGPLALNPEVATAAAAARAADWQFDQFYPESCEDQGLCDALGQQTGIIQWRLDNDTTIREAFYETDADLTNFGFVSSNEPGIPSFIPVFQPQYRAILDLEHGAINADHPDRYKRFIVSGGNPLCSGLVAYSHTALQGSRPGSFPCNGVDLFYELEANGIPLRQWANDFVKPPGNRSVWIDNVEDFVPAPPLGP